MEERGSEAAEMVESCRWEAMVSGIVEVGGGSAWRWWKCDVENGDGVGGDLKERERDKC